jgi:hypothetical protein
LGDAGAGLRAYPEVYSSDVVPLLLDIAGIDPPENMRPAPPMIPWPGDAPIVPGAPASDPHQ